MALTEDLESMFKTIDDGRYWLECIPDKRGVELVVHPSVDGECWSEVVLGRLSIYREELGLAPGQTWPMKLNLGRRLIQLPFPNDDYEEALGPKLALRVMHMLNLAYRAETKGEAGDGTRWRDPNLEIVPMWELVNDRTLLLNERLKMRREAQ